FIGLLSAHKIKALADVRRFPASRYNPQFNQKALWQSLRNAGISYHHMVSLGGRREGAEPSSANYAEYAKTEHFQAALAPLEDIAGKNRVAIMCAEALPSRCHRRFIAAAMERHGFTITHIMSPEHDRVAKRSPTLPGL
ncbi:MAG: repair protein, partial [Rhodospirillales bacterium]|nr:repair protein [Rhodospirillales bacterium]